MANKLVIVESPGKIKKITEYLGSDYIVKASFGHCMDLDPKTLSIDVENNYKPYYVICEGKHKVVSELKQFANNFEIILAADEDREGEAIAWFLQDLLKLNKPKRIVFHEITKKAINDAVANPREINMDMVWAQQTRRLLDRLVGYKISPILWKHMNTNTIQSAGRVQSVVLKIINDKENEISKSINKPYFKTSVQLLHKKNKITGILSCSNNEIYKFENIDNAKYLLNKIDAETIFKVTDIQNKKSIRKPAPPFITSSLQQEASTKLRFGVQKTMQIAQKLYEDGFITYMRTDSTSLSKDALNACKKYIVQTWGENYSKPIQYNIKNDSAQEAHEAIRPTNIDITKLDDYNKDGTKLYDLIWKRTIASQMTPAELNIQTIKIDTLNMNISIIKEYNSLWVSTFESIIFDGFLILYNDKNDEDSDEKIDEDNKKKSKIEVKIDTILNFDNIKVSEEYTKLPLRFNEANLVKYLETNNIGRPSTYASIINKIMERKYVEIKDIEGIKKDSKQVELDKKFKLKESVKEVTLGKENKKIVPSDLGMQVNNFMVNNFAPIIEVQFTADFEKYLDMIAQGKAKWYNILDKFYKMFNPIVEELNKVSITKSINNDKLLGINPNTNQEIWIGAGKYGDYIKIEEDGKYKFISISDNEIELDDAIKLLEYPKILGKYNKKNLELCKGKFGFYIKHGDKNISFNQEDINKIDIEYCKNLIESGDKFALNTFKIKDTTINIKKGQYGPYLQLINSKNKIIKNIPIPNDINHNTININDVIYLIKK
jgi:DNA topoisomerase-1